MDVWRERAAAGDLRDAQAGVDRARRMVDKCGFGIAEAVLRVRGIGGEAAVEKLADVMHTAT